MNRKEINDLIKEIREELKKDIYSDEVTDIELFKIGLLKIYNNGITHAAHEEGNGK